MVPIHACFFLPLTVFYNLNTLFYTQIRASHTIGAFEVWKDERIIIVTLEVLLDPRQDPQVHGMCGGCSHPFLQEREVVKENVLSEGVEGISMRAGEGNHTRVFLIGYCRYGHSKHRGGFTADFSNDQTVHLLQLRLHMLLGEQHTRLGHPKEERVRKMQLLQYSPKLDIGTSKPGG